MPVVSMMSEGDNEPESSVPRVIPERYVWLVWASAFLVPWGLLYWRLPDQRLAMRWASLFTAPFGLTEPLFVPRYWNPPSLFDLAQRTGFDVESLIFSFGIGGVAAVLVSGVTGRDSTAVPPGDRALGRHRFHRVALLGPFGVFVVLLPFGWNPIYPAITAMLVGAAASAWCRPELIRPTLAGGAVFTLYYMLFLTGLELTAPPGYIQAVWNLKELSGVVLGFIPLEELLFAAGFGCYWGGVYEHMTWRQATRTVRKTKTGSTSY